MQLARKNVSQKGIELHINQNLLDHLISMAVAQVCALTFKVVW